VLLSSTSSKDKTQEEQLKDIMQSWDSIVQTAKILSTSFCSIQRKQSCATESVEEHTSTLESMIGKYVDCHLKEDYITVWDAISFLQSGLDLAGKNLSDLQTMKNAHDNALSKKLKALEESVQSTFSKISQSFQDLVTFTKVLSDEQAIASQQFKATLDADGTLTELRRDVQLLGTRISTKPAIFLLPLPPLMPLRNSIH
jgi:hypothetical protein